MASKKVSNLKLSLGCQQAAEYLGVSIKTVRRWAQSGRLEGTKVGARGDWRFTKAQLDVMIRSGTSRAKTTSSKSSFDQNEKMFSKAFHASPMAMAITRSSDGIWIDSNKQFLQMTGYSRDEIVGHSSRELGIIVEDTQTERYEKTRRALDKNGVYANFELMIRTKKGALKRLKCSSVALTFDGEEHIMTSSVDVTEQARTEEISQYLGALNESMSDAVISLDKDRRIVTWNKAAQKLYGWSAKEAIGTLASELIATEFDNTPTYMGKTPEAAYEVLLRGGHWNGEVVQYTKNGAKKDIQAAVSAIKNRNGELIGTVAVNRDISQRKRAERALAEREQRYRVLFNSIDEGFCIIELIYNDEGKAIDYRFLEVNAVFEKVSRMKNPLGRTLREWVPDVSNEWIVRYAKVAETGKSNRSTDWSESNGRWYEVYATRVGGAGSSTIALLFTDVTKQRHAEDERESASRQVINTLESISDGFFKLDQKWNIIMVNERFLTLTRKKREKILGRNFWKIFPSAKGPNSNFYKSFLRVMATKKASAFVEYYSPLEIWAEVNAYPAEDGISIFMRDITQQRLAEKEQELYRQLAREHTELIKVNKAKDEFIGIASHQLRTPATAVKQYIGIVLSGIGGDITEIQREFLEVAHNSNERQLKLINDLLKTAQIDAETFTLNRSQHVVASLVEEAVHDLGPIFKQRGQQVVVNDLSKGTTANVDGIEMDLVFSNLLENASKYSKEGKKITASIRKKAHSIDIAIADEGVGISDGDQTKIFEKFTRVDNELSDTISGTGLGLYWVRHIVDMHGGRITVSSVLNKGTVFTVTLPL